MDAATSIPRPVPPLVPRIDMWYAGNAEQRRWTVLIRIILLIPQIVVLWLLSVVLFFVLVIGWFGALFMGRLPGWAHEFIGGWLHWVTRFDAYALLLTDRYPPFSLNDEQYPVRPVLPTAGPLNRAAVFFRVILVIPAAVFAEIVLLGLTAPLLVVTWFIVLIAGRMPDALYSAYSAALRYQIRFTGFYYMLTSEYPWGMLGDDGASVAEDPSVSPASYPPPAGFGAGAGAAGAAAASAAGGGAVGQQAPQYPSFGAAQPPAPWGAAGSEPAGAREPDVPHEGATAEQGQDLGAEPPYGQPSQPYGQQPASPPTGPPPAEPTPSPATPTPSPAQPPPPPPSWPPPSPSAGAGLGSMPPPGPSEWAPEVGRSEEPGWARLVLTGAARGWMIFAIVWGLIAYLGGVGLETAIGHNTTSNVDQYNTIVRDFNATHTTVNAALLKAQTCTTVACLRESHLNAADSLTRFHDDLQGMSLPSNTANSARQVESDTRKLATIFTDLAHSSGAADYRSTVTNSNLEEVLSGYPQHTQNLLNDLRSSL